MISSTITDLVISLTQEFEFLSLFVHEDTVQVTGFSRADFDSFVSPSHHLASAYVRWKQEATVE